MAKFESGSDKGSVLTSANDDDYSPSLVPKALQSDEAIGGAMLAGILGYLGIGANEYRKAKEKYLEDVSKKDAEIQEKRRKKAEAWERDFDADMKASEMMGKENREEWGTRGGFSNRQQVKKGTILGNTKGR